MKGIQGYFFYIHPGGTMEMASRVNLTGEWKMEAS